MFRWNLTKDARTSASAALAGLRRHPGAGNLGPGGEGLDSSSSVFGSGAVVSVEVEEAGDGIVDGKEALDLSG